MTIGLESLDDSLRQSWNEQEILTVSLVSKGPSPFLGRGAHFTGTSVAFRHPRPSEPVAVAECSRLSHRHHVARCRASFSPAF